MSCGYVEWFICTCLQCSCVLCRIKLLEATDHIVEDKAESERPSKKKKKLKGRKKKTVPEPPPAVSEDGGVEQEAAGGEEDPNGSNRELDP